MSIFPERDFCSIWTSWSPPKRFIWTGRTDETPENFVLSWTKGDIKNEVIGKDYREQEFREGYFLNEMSVRHISVGRFVRNQCNYTNVSFRRFIFDGTIGLGPKCRADVIVS